MKTNSHLMTGPKGNSEYCFSETLINVNLNVKTSLADFELFSRRSCSITSSIRVGNRLAAMTA